MKKVFILLAVISLYTTPIWAKGVKDDDTEDGMINYSISRVVKGKKAWGSQILI